MPIRPKTVGSPKGQRSYRGKRIEYDSSQLLRPYLKVVCFLKKHFMAITKEKKQEIVAKLHDAFANAKSFVFVNFHGLNVLGISEMRRALKNAGVTYFVAKKTLVRRALTEAKLEGEIPELPGELAIAWSQDLIAPAREVYGFQKKNPDNLKILGGIFEGKILGQVDMMEIATIPPLPVLHGKFVNIINSPIQRFVIALDQIASKKV